MTLTPVNKQIATLLPDDTNIKVEVAPWSDGEHRIGEKKRITLEYTTDFDISGFVFYINLALFMPEGLPNPIIGKGNYFYAVQMPSSGIGSGVDYIATLQTTGGDPFLQNYVNYVVKVTPDGVNSFTITIDFYMVHDLTAYVQYNGNTQVYKKFLNDVYYHPMLNPTNSNLAATDTGSPNIYATPNISPRVYFYMVNPDAVYPQPSISREEKFEGLRAGYYYKDRTNTDPWFTNTYIETKRGGNVVNNLSSTQKTNCTIFANTDSVDNPVTHFLVWIFRVDVGNLYTDFINGTTAEFQWIKASNTSTTKICAPMSDPTDLGGNQWAATFDLNPMPYGAIYRMIGIAYSATVSFGYKVNSYITGQLVVDDVPKYDGNGFDVHAALDDYNRQFDGNDVLCAIEERMRSKIKLDFPFNKWKNDIYNRLGLVVGNDIRRYLTNVVVSIYDTNVDLSFGTIQNIYDYKASTKIGINSYTPQSGLTMNFSNTWAEFIYEWRNRFEANTPCIGTLVNGSNILPVQGMQYWGGKTLTIKWNLQFTYDNYFIPFTDDIVFFQQIRVKDYGSMSVKHIESEDARVNFDELSNFCNDEEVCFCGVTSSILADRKLIVNIYPENAGVNSVEEAEVWVGSQLPQLTSNKIINEEEDYHTDAGKSIAKFCIDTSKLSLNSSYTISAMAKKFEDTGYRVTEKGNPSVIEQRITESNSKRTTN
jgi:hypothetical protein